MVLNNIMLDPLINASFNAHQGGFFAQYTIINPKIEMF